MSTNVRLKIDSELEERLSFLDLDAKSSADILRLKPTIDREIQKAMDRFYAKVHGVPGIDALFRDQSHVAQARGAQMSHWESLSGGRFDQEYHQNVRRIGKTHARIGLAPRWYVGGYALIAEHLIKALVLEYWPKTLFQRKPAEAAESLGASLGALIKGIFLDMELSISIYLEAAETERKRHQEETKEKDRLIQQANEATRLLAEAEAKALATEREAVLRILGEGLARLSNKDLAFRMKDDLPPAYAKLREDFNASVEQFAVAFQSINESVESVHAGSQQIAVAANDLSRRNEQQVSTLEETAAALEQVTAAGAKAADTAKQVNEVVVGAKKLAINGGAVVSNAVGAMGRIEKSSQEVNAIIGAIDEIAFQTNLLALNAGVEAARAGEAGRGFAVVASEVRALAQRAAGSAKQIKALVSGASGHVTEGVGLVSETGQSLMQIEGRVREIASGVADITEGAREQASALAEINTAMGHMDKMTQQNASMAEQSTAASQSLAQESESLRRLISQFHLPPPRYETLEQRRASAAPQTSASRQTSTSFVGQKRTGGTHETGRRAIRSAVGAPTIIEEWDDF